MILLVGGEKGGTGKTTLATNLAVYLARKSRDVLLLDVDRQGSASRWATMRVSAKRTPHITCVAKYGDVVETVRHLSTKYNDIVIDAGGGDNEEMRTALLVAHTLIVPVRPSLLDLWTSAHLQDVVRLARSFNRKLALKVVLSQVPTHHKVTERKEAEEVLQSFKSFSIAQSVIHMRKIYRDAVTHGCGVEELDNGKARAEADALAGELCGLDI